MALMVLADLGKGTPEIILMASGSEVSLIIEAGQKLAEGWPLRAPGVFPQLGFVRSTAYGISHESPA